MARRSRNTPSHSADRLDRRSAPGAAGPSESSPLGGVSVNDAGSSRALLVLVSAVLTASLALGFLAATTPSAKADQPKATCYGDNCTDLNPADTVCADDAVTLYEREAVTEDSTSWGVIELRYSAQCHSNWVRFTPWGGVKGWISNLAASAEVSGSPWIWRDGVDAAPRGTAGRSSPFTLDSSITAWTAMITADGATCMSVDVWETEYSDSGQGERRDLGNATPGCFN